MPNIATSELTIIEKVERMLALTAMTRQIVEHQIRALHPTFSEKELREEMIRKLYWRDGSVLKLLQKPSPVPVSSAHMSDGADNCAAR